MSQSFKQPGKTERDAGISALIKRMNDWNIPEKAVDRVHEAARASLNEVKALTEYEDGKVSRLLTVIAFLSAVVGAVFTRFATDYAWPGLDNINPSAGWLLPTSTYFTFFIYAVVVTWSVFTALNAIRPTFNVPATWNGHDATGLPPSMIFYNGMLDVSAPKWGEAFETLAGEEGTDLKRYYAKCYVIEAYLVAEKVAQKLAAINPCVNALRAAMVILMVFFVLFAATIAFVDPTHSGAVPPSLLTN
ncbi:hypothetical protein [Mesorhizobium sp. LNJC405B00]|uniref:hypothetical protein n=1 Tax=Mesorhizobium sp. LNJC405B00 TaxID=1287281 RepID=UPI000A892453|nr:hypothetical protein [Mesorhizobium sp. LNJC405B00]